MRLFRLLAASAAVAAATAAAVGMPARAETPPDAVASPGATSTAGLGTAAQGSAADPQSAPQKPRVEMPSCAANPDLLGLSRIVEINTETGPHFGDQYRNRNEVAFLEDHEVILTFDDGPLKRYTDPILAALEAQCTRATFFSVGRMAIADPETLKEVIRRGHTVGVHTWSHKNLGKLDAKGIKYEFELGLSAVAKAAGSPVAPFFRFPYLADTRTGLDYIGKRGMGIFGIHVDSEDFRTRSPGVVLKNVMAQLDRVKKGIILFHDIQPSTAGAVASLLSELKAKGYKVVHMIPAGPPKTLPEFDAIAERALAAKAKAVASDPMASRAVTWPVSSTPIIGDDQGASDELPWLAKVPTTAEATPPPAAPAKTEKPSKRPAKTAKPDTSKPASHSDIKPLGN